PANVRDDYDVIIAGIDRGLSGVIRGQLVICVINSVLTYIGLLVFGVKYSLLLAMVAGLMSLIPIFGSILSSVPIVIVALVSGAEGIDIFRGVAMTLWIIGIHFIEANLLNPKIIGTAAKIHPVLVIFSLFLGEHQYGLAGGRLSRARLKRGSTGGTSYVMRVRVGSILLVCLAFAGVAGAQPVDPY